MLFTIGSVSRGKQKISKEDWRQYFLHRNISFTEEEIRYFFNLNTFGEHITLNEYFHVKILDFWKPWSPTTQTLSDSLRPSISIPLKSENSMLRFNSYSLNYFPTGSNSFEALWKLDQKSPKLLQKNKSSNSLRKISFWNQNLERRGNSMKVFKQEISLDLDFISWENSLNFG